VAVASTSFATSSAGGELIGGAPSSADARFQMVSTLGGGATLFYRTPDLADLPPGQTRTTVVQVAAVDTADRPVSLVGTATITLVRGQAAQVSTNPQVLKPDAACHAEVTVVVTDSSGAPVPARTRVAATAAPVFAFGSVGGTIGGGTSDSFDTRFVIFETASLGDVSFTYTPPNLTLATGESRTVWIQIAAVNEWTRLPGCWRLRISL
jgi:hypothetical protein